jgi:hypothetical protein
MKRRVIGIIVRRHATCETVAHYVLVYYRDQMPSVGQIANHSRRT